MFRAMAGLIAEVASAPAAPSASAPAASGGCPVMHSGTAANGVGSAGDSSRCPVRHGPSSKSDGAAAAGPGGRGGSGGCPVLQKHNDAGCGSDSLNPLNRMPNSPAQHRADGQEAALSTERVQSTIPKGGNDGSTWEYPSQQMFYNALARKGKGAGVDEGSMESVVAIHNNMNEKTWKRVLEWEQLHCDECSEPRRLIRFVGRPHELTPKAALKYYLGMAPRPFDRHDWTVDRCGKEVRYVIDYYDVPEHRQQDRMPKVRSARSLPATPPRQPLARKPRHPSP
jgi:cytochrome c heme-lyase